MKLQPFSLRDFSKGRYSKNAVSNSLVPENSVSNSVNINYDEIVGAAKVRPGTVKLGATVASGKTPLGLSPFIGPAGTPDYLLAVFSGTTNGTLYYYDNGTNLWNTASPGLSTWSNTLKNRFATFGGHSFITNSSNGMADSADANTWATTNSIGTYKPSLVFRYKARLLASGDPTYPDRVFFSSIIDPVSSPFITWDVDPSVGDWIDINPDDGGYCYDAETEILTSEGWKRFYDLNKNEEVFTLNPTTGLSEWKKPTRYIEKQHEGEMVHLSSKTLDIFVTPEHSIFVKDPKKDTTRRVRADKIKSFSGYIPRTSKWEGKNIKSILDIPIEKFVKLLGIYLAEGSAVGTNGGKVHDSNYRMTISQTKSITKDEIRELLKTLPFKFFEHKNGFNFQNKKAWEYFRLLGNSHTKFIPENIKNLPPELLTILIEWMMKGDGSVDKGRSRYYTVSKRLADDFQEVLQKIGLSGHIYKRFRKETFYKGKRIYSPNIQYSVSIIKSQNAYLADSGESYIKKGFYKGKVYCVDVPNHVIYVRRNGKPIWCGNCTGFSETSTFCLVFKNTGMYRMDTVAKAVDPENIFNVGAVSQEAIVLCQGVTYYFSGVDIRRTNGGYPEQISRFGVQDFIDAIPQANWVNVCSGTDQLNVYFFIGNVTLNQNTDDERTYTNVVLKFSPRDETWSVHSYAQTYRFFASFITNVTAL